MGWSSCIAKSWSGPIYCGARLLSDRGDPGPGAVGEGRLDQDGGDHRRRQERCVRRGPRSFRRHAFPRGRRGGSRLQGRRTSPRTGDRAGAWPFGGRRGTDHVRPAPGTDVAGDLGHVLLPTRRGSLTAEVCTEAARAMYADSSSVHVLEVGQHPDTLWVRGSNRVHVAYAQEPNSGTIVAMSAIDNLVKGASGQAIQCLNVRFRLDEGAGLEATAQWP